MENKKLILPSIALIALLGLSGCATDSATSPEETAAPAETSAPSDTSDASTDPEAPAPVVDYLSLTAAEIIALAEENVVLRDQEEFTEALASSAAAATELGLIETSKITGNSISTQYHIPAGLEAGITFVADEEGQAFEDTIATFDKGLTTLASLQATTEANAFRGYVKQANGEIILKLIPDEEGTNVFVYVVSINEDGLISQIIMASRYDSEELVVVTEFSYETLDDALVLLESLNSDS